MQRFYAVFVLGLCLGGCGDGADALSFGGVNRAALDGCVDLPAMNSAAQASDEMAPFVPPSYEVTVNSPDVTDPVSAFFRNDATFPQSDISGASYSGGTVIGFLGDAGSTEALSTTLTGLSVGEPVIVAFSWQQLTLDAGFAIAGGSLRLTVDGTETLYQSGGVDDDWQIVRHTFTPASTSAVVVIAYDDTDRAGGATAGAIVFDAGRTCELPVSVQTFEGPDICGNGVVENSEACDDGGTVSGDGCTDACALEDLDADGTLSDVDPDDSDGCTPAVDVAACDSDNDGSFGDVDPDNTNPCTPAANIAACDADNDGSGGDVDPDDANPCVPSVNAAACDADDDGSNADVDPDDADPCVPSAMAAACDADNDGSGGDVDPDNSDPCVPSAMAAACDADNDGSGGDIDSDNSDPCVPSAMAAACDADNDGSGGDVDPDNSDPCVPSASAPGCDDGGSQNPDPSPTPGPGPDVDSDGDGLSDADEIGIGTDPNVADTDGDGVSDADELIAGSDPLVPFEVSGGSGSCSQTGAALWTLVVPIFLRRRRRPKRTR